MAKGKARPISRRVKQARPKLVGTSTNGARAFTTIESRRLDGLLAIAEDNRESNKRYAALVAGTRVNTMIVLYNDNKLLPDLSPEDKVALAELQGTNAPHEYEYDGAMDYIAGQADDEDGGFEGDDEGDPRDAVAQVIRGIIEARQQ